MTTVPSNLVPTRISQLTEYLGTSTEGYLPYVLNGITYKVQFSNIAAVGAVPSSRTITGGDGLAGGGDLSTNRVIYLADGGVTYDKLANSGVAAGTYGSASTIPVLNVDAKGRVTGASSVSISLNGYVPTSRAIIAGDGLSGGGTLTTNRTISLALTAAEPQPLGVPVAGSSTFAARDDHVHPAVNLTNTTETSGVLPMSRGGTGSALTPAAGAILYTTGSETTLSNAGSSGQFFVSGGTAGPSWFNVTGGSTGLTFGFSGSNYRLAGTLAITSGGTGATTVSGARVNLLPSYTGNGGKVLALNAGATDLEWKAITGTGTVTSVDVSGGTTGLTTSGGPITAAGTITLGGTLAPTAGGTGITSFAVGDLLFANTTTSLDTLHVGTNGYLLASNGTAPQYVNPTSVTVGAATTATTATNLAGGASGSIPYQSGSGTTTFLASGTGVIAASGGAPAYTMTPSLTQVTVAADPTLALQVATKQYVDTIATTSVHYHTPVKYEVPNTTGNLTATYNNGASGVGATLTNAGTKTAFTPDGIVASVGDRILIYNQTNAYENGVYTVTVVGNGSTNWVLTRATDANTYDPISPNSLGGGDAFFVTSGNTGAGETYVCNNVGPITFGTTAISFVQVSATQVYSAGTGLTLTGTTFSLTAPVATSLGGTGLTSFTSGGAVYATSTSALTTGTLPITAGGTGQTTASAAFNALSPITTTGDLIIGNGTNSATRLGIGANGYILSSNGTTAVWSPAPSSMVYPGAGIPNSTGSAWGTSYSTTGSGTVVALATSPTFTTSVGIGGAASSNTTLRIGTNLTGATNVLGAYNNQAVQSDVTGNASLFATYPSTAAAAFTLGSLTHYSASLNSIGSGSTVTTQIGFFAQSTLTGATNNYGFYGAIASGTGRYNLYMAGTADNYLAGNLGIGTASPGQKLTIAAGRISLDEAYQVFWQGAGTNRARIYGDSGSNFIIETGAANTERFRISANGAIGLSGPNYGSAGQVLTSNGSGSAPTWQAASGGLSRAQVTAISMILGF